MSRALPSKLSALLLALAFGATSAYADDPVRIGFVGTSLASVPIVVAEAKGFFAAQGLDTKLMPFESSQPIALAIASGDADFGTTGLSEPFFVLGHQGTLRIIGGDTVERKGFHGLGFVASNQAYAAGLASVKALGGHSVGITQPGSPLEFSLALVLEKYRIDFQIRARNGAAIELQRRLRADRQSGRCGRHELRESLCHRQSRRRQADRLARRGGPWR